MIDLIEWGDEALTPENVGKKFRDLRKEKGLSLKQVAEAAGISLYSLHKIETSENPNPQFLTMVSVLRVLEKEVVVRSKHDSN